MQRSKEIRKVLIKIEEEYLLSTGWVKSTDTSTGNIRWLSGHSPLWKTRDAAIFEQKSLEYNEAIKNNINSDWKFD